MSKKFGQCGTKADVKVSISRNLYNEIQTIQIRFEISKIPGLKDF